MGRVGGCQGQAHAYSVGLAEEGLSFSFLDSRRPCSLVLKATGDTSGSQLVLLALGREGLMRVRTNYGSLLRVDISERQLCPATTVGFGHDAGLHR